MCGGIRGSDYSLVQRLAWQNRLESEETEVRLVPSTWSFRKRLGPTVLLISGTSDRR